MQHSVAPVNLTNNASSPLHTAQPHACPALATLALGHACGPAGLVLDRVEREVNRRNCEHLARFLVSGTKRLARVTAELCENGDFLAARAERRLAAHLNDLRAAVRIRRRGNDPRVAGFVVRARRVDAPANSDLHRDGLDALDW